MSSNVDFEDFNFDDHKNSPRRSEKSSKKNMSIDWDHFDAPGNDNSLEHSAITDVFNKEKEPESKKSESLPLDDSRDINEISVFGVKTEFGSFRFEREDSRGFPKVDERFRKMQNIMQASKANGLEQFYQAIDRENKAYSEEPNPFSNYSEFKNHIRELKREKKIKEENSSKKDLTNPFGTSSSNYSNPFTTINNTNPFATVNNANQMYDSVGSNQFNNKVERLQIPDNQPPRGNFSKKNPHEVLSSNSLFPKEECESNFYDSARDIPNSTSKKSLHPPPPQPPPSFEASLNLDDFPSPKTSSLNPSSSLLPSPPVPAPTKTKAMRQGQSSKDIHRVTAEEKKLEEIMEGYSQMRKQFEELLSNLEQTTQGQNHIVEQLQSLTSKKYEEEMLEAKKLLREKKEKEIEEKKNKLEQIKEEIKEIQNSNNDIVYEQINKKIEGLENLVKNALEEISEEKEAKLVPKVINYFCDHGNLNNSGNENSLDLRGEDLYEPTKLSGKLSFSRRTQKPFSNSQKNSFQKNEGHERFLEVQFETITPKSPHEKLGESFENAPTSNYENSFSEICSPFDVEFMHHAPSNYEESFSNEEFFVEDFAEEYQPKEIISQGRNIRNSILQKNSIVFDNLDIQVGVKFTIVEDESCPIIGYLKVTNKCSISLFDAHCVAYGSQSSSIETNPSTVFEEELKKGESLLFEIYMDQSCLEENGFHIQTSYKTDQISKKRANFRVPLPLIQILQPQFVYEEKFLSLWKTIRNELYVFPQNLSSKHYRNHKELKLLLPFIEISDENVNFSYGLIFKYPSINNQFLLKVNCYNNTKVSIHLRCQKNNHRKFQEEILNVFSFLFFSEA